MLCRIVLPQILTGFAGLVGHHMAFDIEVFVIDPVGKDGVLHHLLAEARIAQQL
jgi:hypothetical protein